MIPLTLLSAGQTAQVSAVLGQPDQVHRLQELGIRDGTQIEMLRPGSPCIVRVDGAKLCLRGDDGLFHVLVQPGVAL